MRFTLATIPWISRRPTRTTTAVEAFLLVPPMSQLSLSLQLDGVDRNQLCLSLHQTGTPFEQERCLRHRRRRLSTQAAPAHRHRHRLTDRPLRRPPARSLCPSPSSRKAGTRTRKVKYPSRSSLESPAQGPRQGLRQAQQSHQRLLHKPHSHLHNHHSHLRHQRLVPERSLPQPRRREGSNN